MDPATCRATYILGLSKAHVLQEQAVAAKTMQQNARELADWLHNPRNGRTMHICLPEDIMVYLTTHWLRTHAGTTTTKTRLKVSAPDGLSGVKSSLSTELGRTGEWKSFTMQGNAMLSNQLRRMTKRVQSWCCLQRV